MSSIFFSKCRSMRAGLLSALLAISAHGGAAEPPQPKPLPARATPGALQAPLLGVACAGKRQVAVGERGVILLSDDAGQHWRQARQVPVDVVLTSVAFVDERHGWAVGHWGVVLRTDDGGETWKLQRIDTSQDRPLFAVYFFTPEVGVAVGLWSQVLGTSDGGKTWDVRNTGLTKASGQSDLNLFGLFTNRAGTLYAVAERGVVLRSADQGRQWEPLLTGARGSLWTGLATPAGRLIVAGLRGAMLVSDDDGRHWRTIEHGARESITGLAMLSADRVTAVGFDGVQLRSEDGGQTFALQRREDRLPLTAIASCPAVEGPVIMSVHGPLPSGSDR